MPKELHEKLERAGVRNPHAVMNRMGLMKGSKHTYSTSKDDATKKVKAYIKARKFVKKSSSKKSVSAY